jgi:BirA family biotin operon repressor/biotin-[acetyl-CoA-carboxylase] ligase
MSKIIQCLKLIPKAKNQFELAKLLGINWLELLELIGEINQIENGLINNSSAGGIMLTRPLDWITDAKVIKNLAKLEQNNYTVKMVDEINSTNTYILNNIGALDNKTVVSAELQSGGRGRNNKTWLSKIATDLTVSFLYLFPLEFNYELLPLVVAVCLNRLLKQYRIPNLIKWPNDIYSKGTGKIAGILLESGIRDNKRFVVVGIGLDNILDLDRALLLSNLIYHMEHVITEYSAFGFAMFRQEWLDNCMHYNKKVSLYKSGNLLDSGINIDLTSAGDLVIKSKNQIKEYNGNSISLTA